MKTFETKYLEIQDQLYPIVYEAKRYIVENWKKVKDWSDLDIYIEDYSKVNHNKRYHFYKMDKPKPTNSKIIYDLVMGIYEDQNPVKSVSNVVLDESDGDFSISINGIEFWWIGDWEVITIATYIEEQLNTEK